MHDSIEDIEEHYYYTNRERTNKAYHVELKACDKLKYASFTCRKGILVIDDMLGENRMIRDLVINKTADKFGLDKIRDDAARYFERASDRYWERIFEEVLNDEKRITKYANVSRRLANRGSIVKMPTHLFIRSTEFRVQRGDIVRSIRECRTTDELTRLFNDDPHTTMIIAFLNYWIRGVGDGW